MKIEFKNGGFTPKVVNNVCFVSDPKTDKVIGGSLMSSSEIVAGIAYMPEYFDSDVKTSAYCKIVFTEMCLCAGRLFYAGDTLVIRDSSLHEILNYIFKKH